jgi:hypothetical protein
MKATFVRVMLVVCKPPSAGLMLLDQDANPRAHSEMSHSQP